MTKEDLYEGFLLFSRGEQDALFELIAGNTPTHICLERLVLARRRTQQRRDSDSETDLARRLLVGARLPRQTVERYRECAFEHGLSLYAFASSALEREYQRLTE